MPRLPYPTPAHYPVRIPHASLLRILLCDLVYAREMSNRAAIFKPTLRPKLTDIPRSLMRIGRPWFALRVSTEAYVEVQDFNPV